MKDETIYRVGDTVYFLLPGGEESSEGIIEQIRELDKNPFPIYVRIKGFDGFYWFTIQGCSNVNPSPTLSFAPYNIHTGGFSQVRPMEIPKEGQLVYVRVNIEGEWLMRFFSHKDEGRSGICCFNDQLKYGKYTYWPIWQLENPMEE